MPSVGKVTVLRDLGVREKLGPRERWTKYGLRVVFVGAFLLLVAVAAYLAGNAHGVRSATRTVQVPAAANPGAEGYAVRFVTDYLTYDSSDQPAYENRVAPYLAQGVDPHQLWNGAGKQTVEQATAVEDRDAGNGVRIITVSAHTDSGRWVYVGVPVLDRSGAYAVIGNPALLPGPARASWSGHENPGQSDVQLADSLQSPLSAFFTAYAGSDRAQLSYDTTPDAGIGGLGGAVTLSTVQSLTVSQGGPNRRAARAVVQWTSSSGAQYTQAYSLQLQQRDGKWLVSSLAPATGGTTS